MRRNVIQLLDRLNVNCHKLQHLKLRITVSTPVPIVKLLLLPQLSSIALYMKNEWGDSFSDDFQLNQVLPQLLSKGNLKYFSTNLPLSWSSMANNATLHYFKTLKYISCSQLKRQNSDSLFRALNKCAGLQNPSSSVDRKDFSLKLLSSQWKSPKTETCPWVEFCTTPPRNFILEEILYGCLSQKP
ncbi:hypothetical protein DdX_11689 [Ditylenchus destructor]|uniref:Uncharacterized protein n=1 Tax=Ditylenchus destructor TaxID=166010 RepID=A0AAD4R4A5_9BILA|nr:hypothetical protein DdX_11689 [Ditylenchus destructor]